MTTMNPEYARRYEAALHAMQTGVSMQHAAGSNDGSPKHLRVGVNSAMVADAALAKLLIAKGIFTLDEYGEALATAAEEEVLRYEAILSRDVGAEIHLS